VGRIKKFVGRFVGPERKFVGPVKKFVGRFVGSVKKFDFSDLDTINKPFPFP